LAEYKGRYEELASLGYKLVAVSVDTPERSRALADQLRLPFTLLCDPAREVVQLFGVFNRKEKGGIAYPATFVLSRERVVRFRSLDRTAARVDLDGLFQFLRRDDDDVDVAPHRPPARSRIAPTFADWARMVKNALRFGVRSPKA
jgi:peroxiredoxin